MIAAILAGWEFVQGIEMSEEYCTIGGARMKFWSRFGSYEEAMEAARSAQRGQRRREAEVEKGQLGLWQK